MGTRSQQRNRAQELKFASQYDSKIGLSRAAKKGGPPFMGAMSQGAQGPKNEYFMKFSRMSAAEEGQWKAGYDKYKRKRAQTDAGWRNRHG